MPSDEKDIRMSVKHLSSKVNKVSMASLRISLSFYVAPRDGALLHRQWQWLCLRWLRWPPWKLLRAIAVMRAMAAMAAALRAATGGGSSGSSGGGGGGN